MHKNRFEEIHKLLHCFIEMSIKYCKYIKKLFCKISPKLQTLGSRDIRYALTCHKYIPFFTFERPRHPISLIQESNEKRQSTMGFCTLLKEIGWNASSRASIAECKVGVARGKTSEKIKIPLPGIIAAMANARTWKNRDTRA